ncbi:hypothetical protein [Paracoccus fistulariae]|uniref:Lipoprotein n=1 Tax=Paracoccus fistulariae TaxID=658446 RepID=A0ABY7SK70_9RHOB|nr:hypothetical protein [Paracoccus fistulariae]MDB6181333.1 hypothetical protein [Paracoccus fistulariae]WCR07382.1 hypothetical protein JHX87_00555 [Paracoccus fistulariae]
MIRQTAIGQKTGRGSQALALLCLFGLAACIAGPSDRVPFTIEGRSFIVSRDAAAPGGLVSAPAGGALSQADGALADRAFHEYCRTQGRNGGPGSYVVIGGVGMWEYGGCRR